MLLTGGQIPSTIVKGTAPSSDTSPFWCNVYESGSGRATKNVIAGFGTIVGSNGNNVFRFASYEPTANSTNSISASLGNNGTVKGFYPAPTNTVDLGTSTNQWKNLYTKEITLDGDLWFTSGSINKRLGVVKGDIPQSTVYPLWWNFFESGTGTAQKNRISAFYTLINASGDVETGLYSYKNEADATTGSALRIVYPKTGDPYAACPTPEASANSNAIATTAWVTTKLSGYSTTDTKVTSTTTKPSGTVWYPISSTSNSTETNTTVKNEGFSYYNLNGTSSAEGFSELRLGNAKATGTADNLTGSVLWYNNKGKYTALYPHIDDTTNREIYLPKSGGTLVCHTTDTKVGDTNKPVYISADGVATAISYTIGKNVPSDAVFTDTKNTAGSTDGSSKTLYLIGASSRSDSAQTYTRSDTYLSTSGDLYIGSDLYATSVYANIYTNSINGYSATGSLEFTDANVKQTFTTPTTSGATYRLVTSIDSGSTTTTEGLRKFGCAYVYLKNGTTSVEGQADLALGNSTASGTAGNISGGLTLYNNKGIYHYISPHKDDTTNRTIYTPKSSGTLVCHTTDTAIGSSSQPVYVTANGVATACNMDSHYPILTQTNLSKLYSDSDLNDITTPGTYWWSTESTNGKPANTPCNYGKMFVINTLSTRWVTQLVFSHDSKIFIRKGDHQSSGDTWDSWLSLSKSDHTHSNYAASDHNHDSRYFSLVGATGTKIADNTDLNTLKTPGTYYCPGSTNAATYTNCPYTGANFKLIVRMDGLTNYGCQMLLSQGAIWIRGYASTTWAGWKRIATTDADITGNAATASKINTSAKIGDTNKPVYVAADGTVTAISYTIGKSVPSDAKFTDTTYSAATTSAAGLMSAADKTKLNGLDDSTYVKLAGAQTITGYKGFTSNFWLQSSSNVEKGSNPTATKYPAWISIFSSSGTAEKNRFGSIGTTVDTSGNVTQAIIAYKNTADSTTSAWLSIVYPKTGDPYATCPTPEASSNGTKIATTAWVTTKLGGYSTTSHTHSAYAASSHTHSQYYNLSSDGTTAIAANTDLDTLTSPGTYRSSSAATTNSLTNCPITGVGFKLTVERTGYDSDTYIMQKLIKWDALYIRAKGTATASWGDWKQISTANDKVTNTLGTTTKFYVTGTTSSTTATGTQYFDTGIYSTTTAGRLHVTSLELNSGIILS